MGLDMYAFSLDRSATFAKPRDVLKFRAPATGQDLPEGPIMLGVTPEMLAAMPAEVRQMFSLANTSPTLDLDAQFLASKYVLPGSTLIHRWRKHPHLHAWMRFRWNMKRNSALTREFDHKVRVPLDEQDLDDLERTVIHRLLPPVCSGPCFGESDGTEQADDLAFIATARKELAAGKFVYYTSWW